MPLVAVPAAVFQSTVTGDADWCESDTVKTIEPDPSRPVGSSMSITGRSSSSTIVPTPVASARVAFEGAVSVTRNISSSSATRSPFTLTAIVSLVSPGTKVSVPDPAV